MNINQYLQKNKKLIDQALDRYLPQAQTSHIAKVMRYSVFAGGKRFRPILMLAVAEVLNKPTKLVMPAAAMVELIHTFTLIHDDLPCMDNDDYRRGRLTAHKKFGEAVAVLAGDAMQAQAYGLMLNNSKGVSAAVRQNALNVIVDAIGDQGVVTGQILDLQAENQKVSLKKLEQIHLLKTAALIRAAVKIAGLICNASAAQVKKLDAYAKHLGLAFQISDDLLDYTSSFAKMGKIPGSDKRLAKSTYVSLLGEVRAQRLLAAERIKAARAADSFGKRAQVLKELVDFVVKRKG